MHTLRIPQKSSDMLIQHLLPFSVGFRHAYLTLTVYFFAVPLINQARSLTVRPGSALTAGRWSRAWIEVSETNEAEEVRPYE
jgi:hypothetical protein